METAHNAKAATLESMNQLVKSLLDKEKATTGVQADEGELIWLPEHYLGVQLSLCDAVGEGRCGSTGSPEETGGVRVAGEECL